MSLLNNLLDNENIKKNIILLVNLTVKLYYNIWEGVNLFFGRFWLIKKNLKGKVALVTGASRGIGKVIALELAKCGASVAINYNSNLRLAKNTLKSVRSFEVNGEIIKAREYQFRLLEKWFYQDNIFIICLKNYI